MSDDAALLAARLARMKTLIADLEKACAEGADQRDAFARLRAELEAARAALKLAKS